MVDANTLETTLKNQQWVGGQSPTVADMEAFTGLKGQNISAETHPNVFAWFFLTSKFSDAIMKSWPAAGAAAGGKPAKGGKGKGGKKEAKKEEDDLDDLFGDDNEDDAEAAKAIAQATKDKAAAKKKVKKVAIAMSLVMLEVKPLDDTIDLDALAQRCFSTILQEGLYWKTEYKKEPVAFGIFKLIVGFSLEDEKVSVDDIVERIEGLEDMVQSVEIAVFNKI
jgi:translation elongation factor EF-1beta|tara:strand:- start:84 stop:752 length:669 start_codon:yes stop_codon:yes gene_type:complete